MSTAGGEPLKQGPADDQAAAFAALYDQYAPSLFRVAWTLLRSRPEAEDAVQDVFLNLVRARENLDRVQNMRAYLFSALRHAASRLAARRKLTDSLPADIDERPAAATPTTEKFDPQVFQRLNAAMSALPTDQREVLVLKIDGEMTFAEVAEVLGIRPNTAASRYRYALEKLRTLLNEKDHEARSVATKLA